MPAPSRAKWMWRDLPRVERLALRVYFRALEAKYGPFSDRVTSAQAKLVCELWRAASSASEAAVSEASKRRAGRGRRPSLQHVGRQQKRQALSVGSYDAALDRLEQMTGGARRPTADELLDRAHRAMRADAEAGGE